MAAEFNWRPFLLSNEKIEFGRSLNFARQSRVFSLKRRNQVCALFIALYYNCNVVANYLKCGRAVNARRLQKRERGSPIERTCSGGIPAGEHLICSRAQRVVNAIFIGTLIRLVNALISIYARRLFMGAITGGNSARY